MRCPECGGEGWLEDDAPVSGIDSNGPWCVIRACQVLCESCDGWGEIDDEE